MASAAPPRLPTSRAALALLLLAVDPAGLRGIWLRARVGEGRDALLTLLARLLPDDQPRRIPPQIDDDRLLGGLDLAATLTRGHPIQRPGLLDESRHLVLPMAERCPPALAARLGQRLDEGKHMIVLLDEGAEADEAPPEALTSRLAIFLGEDDVAQLARGRDRQPELAILHQARQKLTETTCPPGIITDLAKAAVALGIEGVAPLILCLRAARAHAALSGRKIVTEADLAATVGLTLAHLAAPPAAPEAEDASPPATSEPGPGSESSRPEEAGSADLLVEAARAALPPGLLSLLADRRRSRQCGGQGAGDRKIGNRHGSPLPSRRGLPGGDRRIDLLATLRNAAPWQVPRRRGRGAETTQRILLKKDDLVIRRVRLQSDRVLIFAVDASGSAAAGRLAEAKGAVERLLSDAYASRDHVALLTFRGTEAVLDLPPSRSLVRVKNRLLGLPGGGGTPLATALRLAIDTAERARRRGMSPAIALLTDGRGNIALDGTADRVAAGRDANLMARQLRQHALAALVIDVAPRPQAPLRELAGAMGGHYLALPRASAETLSVALSGIMG